MKSMRIIFFVLTSAISAAGASISEATIHNVSTSAQLTIAFAAAVAGDEIVLANGTYNGTFATNNAGTAENRITVRAANQHQAILQGSSPCSTTIGINVLDDYWTFKDLKIVDHGRTLYLNPGIDHTIIEQNIIYRFRSDGVFLHNANKNIIRNNVIGYGVPCIQGHDMAGVFIVTDADNNQVLNNIFISVSNNYSLFPGTGRHHNILIANNSDDNLIQGNMVIGPDIGVMVLAGQTQTSADRNILRDNMILWTAGGNATTDCTDNLTQIINNVIYGNFNSGWMTKGNKDGTKGQHLVEHNLFWTDDFSREMVGFNTGGEPYCDNPVVSYKVNNTIRNNVFYSPRTQSGFHTLINISGAGSTPNALAFFGNNVWWAPGAESTWKTGYTYQASDIRSQPTFTNASVGDFSLQTGSVGKNSATNGSDIGVAYNAFLKKHWLANAFALPTAQKNSIQGSTSTSFIVSTAHEYLIWYYLPDSNSCSINETFTIEGVTRTRDTTMLKSGNIWIQPAGGTLPARWTTLGRHKSTDGTMNISWTNSNCVDKMFIRQLPTVEEAFTWMAGTVVSEPAPSNPDINAPSLSLSIPGRIEAESFNTGGQGIGYNDTTAANLGGAYRTSESVDLKPAPGGSGYTIGYTESGEWLKYDVNASQSANYSITARGANGAATNGNFRVEVDGVNATGTISIPPTGSYSTEVTVNGPTISLAQGVHTLRVYFESGNFDLNWIELTANSVASIPMPPSNVALTPQ